MSSFKPGTVGWFDLTVPDAENVRSFYEQVVGWTSEPMDMGGYNDHSMKAPGADQPVAGICHARGDNAALPPQWLIYIVVTSVDESVARCEQLGGSLVAPVRAGGFGKMAVIRDPAGAVCALFEAQQDSGTDAGAA